MGCTRTAPGAGASSVGAGGGVCALAVSTPAENAMEIAARIHLCSIAPPPMEHTHPSPGCTCQRKIQGGRRTLLHKFHQAPVLSGSPGNKAEEVAEGPGSGTVTWS